MSDEQTAGQGPEGAGGAQGGAPSEEEVRAAFEEQMRRIRVEDVLLQTAATLVNLAARRLGLATEPGQDVSQERDVEQARLAIDGVRALVPLCPEQQVGPLREALSQLQMAFAREAQGAGGAEAAATADAEGGSPASDRPSQPEQDAERAKARAKIWTPPGS